MAKRKFISTRQLKNGDRIDQSVKDRTGRILIERGTLLDDYMISSLLQRGIMGVFTSDGIEEEEHKEIKISPRAHETIEKYEVPDRAKIKLKESVKQRVSEGVSFLYSDTESEGFVDTTTNIANDLMRAITENDSIAVDVGALKISDEYTFKHSVDVATISMIIGKNHGLKEREIYQIGIAGLLHDIGKTKIPNEVLNKPGRLTDDEFQIMKQHSLYGYSILKNKMELSDGVRLGVLQHHEKLNGHGYPLSVTSEKINPYARIISVADIYDALVTERPYKKGFSPRDAVEMIMAMTDELDVGVMRSFLNSIILYPVGSFVKLSNGEIARVLENNPRYTLRPKVVGVATGNIYDLANDLKCANIIIE